jgi:protocatechuate 3,4-dioxygenase beta subunit
MKHYFHACAILFLLPGLTAADPEHPPRTLSASGKVVDGHGQAVAGATVYLREWAALRKQHPHPDQPPSDLLATTTTDQQGLFAFRDVPLPKPYLDELTRTAPFPWDIVAKATGHGLAWQGLTAQSRRRPVTLTLPPEASIQGRLLDRAGQPVAGASVRVLRLQGLDQPLQGVPTTPRNLNLEGSRISLTTASDAEGRWVLKGLPGNIRATLVISDARFAQLLVYAATTDHPQPNVVVNRSRAPDGTIRLREEPVHTGIFSVTVQPGHRLRVRVVGEDSGKPMAGARLRQLLGPTPLPPAPVADARGEFLLSQLQAGRYLMSVAAPARTDYLGVTAPIVIPEEKPEFGVVFQLPAGTVATGQVVEAETGKGIPGVPLTHQPAPSSAAGNRAFAAPVQTGPDGRFRIAIPPGKGSLRIASEVPGYVLTDLFPSPKREAEGRLMHRIDVQPGQELAGVKFTLDRGLVVHLRVRDGDGKAVPGAQVAGVMTGADGRVLVSGLDPRTKQDLFITHLDRQLAVRVAVVPPKKGKSLDLEVKLQPTASVTGRVLDEDHRPLASAMVQLLRLAPGAEEKITFYSTAQAAPITVDADGRFTLDDLVPETQHNVTVSAPGYASAFGAPFDAQAGQRHRLPDILLPRADQTLGGVVVDPRGRPLAGVQVFGTPIRWGGIQQSVRINSGQILTDKEGRFRLAGVPRGLVRLSTYLPPPPNSPDRTVRTSASLQVEAGRQDIRIVLAGPETEGPIEARVGQPAPEFAVRRWFQTKGPTAEQAFRRQDFQDKVVLLAFLDEAKPSQRFLARANQVQEKLAAKGLVIVRVYEAANLPEEFIKRSATPAALVSPGLLPGGYSEAFQKYGVRAVPTLFLIDRQGVLRQTDLELDDLEARLEELLKP